MKINFFEVYGEDEKYFREKFRKHGKFKLRFFKGPVNPKNLALASDSEAIVVFVNSNISDKVLEKLPKLKYIVTMSTGYDHIDLEACKKRKIKVSNVPHYGANTVAEHTFALILALSRKIPEAILRTKQDEFSIQGLEGFDLKGKTLGIIGVGNIGQHVVKIAKGFEMKVVAYSLKKDVKLARKLGFSYASFDNLLKSSDIISFHVPLTTNTKGMINMKNIKKLKRGIYLVNTSRGEIIDTTALKYGLENEIISGAALDVLEGEEDLKDERELLKNAENKKDWNIFMENHLLLKDKNVIVTPHIAFYTKEAVQRIKDTSFDNLLAFSKGKALNKVI